MTMKYYLTLLLAVSLTALHAADTQAGKPNVIIVLTDDQGYGDLSCTGNPLLKTPNMDRLAREGVNFTNFHVDSYCTPTRSALMTGRYCHRVGGWGTVNGRNMLRDEEVTMADVSRLNFFGQVLHRVFHRRFCRAGRGQSELLWRHGLTTTRLRRCRIGHWGGLLQNSLCWRAAFW